MERNADTSPFAPYRLACAAFVALGLARFAYALLLPSMRADLKLSYAAAGLLGTSNTAGYLIGLLLLPFVIARFEMVAAFRLSILCTAFALISTAATRLYPLLLLARFSAGLFGAGAFILGSAIAASLAARYASAVVVFNAAGGFGVIFAGALLPTLLSSHNNRWRVGWLVLGALGIIGTFAVSTVRWTPPTSVPARISLRRALDGQPTLYWLTASYACFGAGYIVFVTFLISTLKKSGASILLTSVAFVLMGAMSIVGPRLWRTPIQSWPQRRLMAATMATQALGAALLLLSRHPVMILCSVAVFGSAFLLTPAVVTITVRASRPPASWASTIGAVTALFAAGQAVAPWLSGALIDKFGVSAGPVWTLSFSLLGMLFALSIRA